MSLRISLQQDQHSDRFGRNDIRNTLLSQTRHTNGIIVSILLNIYSWIISVLEFSVFKCAVRPERCIHFHLTEVGRLEFVKTLCCGGF